MKRISILFLSLAGLLLLVSVAHAQTYDSIENVSVTLEGKAYRYEWGGFENAFITLEGTEYSVIENEYTENLLATVRVPSKNIKHEFQVSGMRVHYHLALHSTKNENAFGIVPEYADGFGWGRREKEFSSDLPMEVLEDKYGKLGGADFDGYVVGNYWYLSGTIVDDSGDDLFESYEVTSFILENRGSLGSPPSGTSYASLVKQFTYYRMAIFKQMMGVLDTFWQDWGAYLTNRCDIVREIRNILSPYVP